MNVRGLCCALADRYGWPPDVVGDMTVAQAEMYLTGGGGGDVDGVHAGAVAGDDAATFQAVEDASGEGGVLEDEAVGVGARRLCPA